MNQSHILRANHHFVPAPKGIFELFTHETTHSSKSLNFIIKARNRISWIMFYSNNCYTHYLHGSIMTKYLKKKIHLLIKKTMKLH